MATPLDAAKALLNRLGIPWSQNRLIGLVAFASEEGGHWANGATYNPWNTTLSMPGAVSKNGAGVKAYTSWSQGIDATARTMLQSNMRPIIDALKSDVSPHDFLVAVTATPWCPKVDAYGNPTGCESYENINPIANYNGYANREDSGTMLAVSPSASSISLGKVVLGLVAIGAVGSAIFYYEKGRLPFMRRARA